MRRRSGRRSMTRSRSCSRARHPPRTWPARSRMRPRPDSEAVLVLPPTVSRARRARVRRHWTTIGLFLAPALALYGLLVIALVLQAIYFSAFDWSGLGPLDDFVGLENFKRVFNDEVFF